MSKPQGGALRNGGMERALRPGLFHQIPASFCSANLKLREVFLSDVGCCRESYIFVFDEVFRVLQGIKLGRFMPVGGWDAVL